ncbi:MAG TPA: CHAT domain-containing tetratricopeptide repeat protein [Pseudonocardiaceae bacterium]
MTPTDQAHRAVDLAYTEPDRALLLGAAVLRAPGEPESAAIAERAMGLAYGALGRLADGQRHLRAAIEVAEKASLAIRAAEARGSLAYLLTLTGDSDAALAETEKAATALHGVPAARLAMQRGLILTEVGRFAEAATVFDDALSILQRAGGDELLEGDIRTNRSILLVHLLDWRGAEEDLRTAEAHYTANGHFGRTAMVWHNRGMAAAVRGDVPGALTAYDEAATRYRKAGRDPGLLPVERAEVLLSVHLVAEARQAAEAAVEQFAGQHNAVDLVAARLVLAQCALQDDDPATAAVEADKARRSAIRQHRPSWATLGAHVALRARWDAGDRTEATLRSARRTADALAAAGWVVRAADARLIMARIAIELGRPVTARRILADASRARRTGPVELRARAWHATALLREAAGDQRGADAALRAGMRVFDRFRAGLGATELRAQVSSHAGEIARQGLAAALASGRVGAVLTWAERWRAGALQFRPARPPDDTQLAEHLAELRQLALALGDDEAAGRDTRDLVRRQAALQGAVRARARHAADDHAPEAGFPGVPALNRALGPAALVEYVSLAGQLYAVVLARTTTLHELGPVDVVEERLAALRFGLRRLAYEDGTARSTQAVAGLVAAQAQALDSLLLAPLDVGNQPLVIVPTGVLHAMPWAALPGCTGRPVSVAPSATLWHRAASTQDDPTGRQVLASGPGLPHAAPEIAALARGYPGASRFTGRRACVDDVVTALDGAQLAHIAAHGRFRADNPLFSALQLSDGPLTVYDLERLTTPPRHVVLSSCDSGLPAVRPGDEVLGLAAALLALGTRSLVATVLPVPDRASRALMLRFHTLRRAGIGPAAALATTQQEFAADPSPQARVTALGYVCLGAS